MAYDLKLLRVLVIDDDRHMSALLRTVLRAFDINDVVLSDNPLEALSYLENHQFDCGFIDLDLTIMTGYELITKIRGHHEDAIRFLPIVAWSSYTDEDRVLEARDVGATEFLVKPFTANAVYERIEAMIERPRPFIQDGDYFGPDRRRKLADFSGGDRRVKAAITVNQMETNKGDWLVIDGESS